MTPVPNDSWVLQVVCGVVGGLLIGLLLGAGFLL